MTGHADLPDFDPDYAFVIELAGCSRRIAHNGVKSRNLFFALNFIVHSDRGLRLSVARVGYLEPGSNPMCDYSLHAVATRPAKVGERLITTTFRGTSTRGFASESDPAVAVCMLPGTELAFEQNVKYDNRWIWTREINFRVGKFGAIEPHVADRHHDAIEFPDGSHVLVTQLYEGQRATVLQLPVVQQAAERTASAADTSAATSVSAG
jgi:hypothetical protein